MREYFTLHRSVFPSYLTIESGRMFLLFTDVSITVMYLILICATHCWCIIQEYRNIRCLLYESTQRTDHSHQRYSNTVSLYSTSIFTHSHICTINDP